MLALVSAAISTASSAGAPLAPHDAGPSSRLATFTLVRGGSSEGDYETLVNSRRCLRQALAAVIDYDDIAFHEGNVPLLIQRSLSERMYHFRFADAREHGGFQVGALTYERARQLVRKEFVYPLGYHHMCHFMSMLWFQALRGYEYAMRVDEDVCITRMPTQSLATALSSDYAFGLEIREAHQRTIETFNPWLENYMSSAKLLPTIPPLPTERIFFTNFFVARLAWWHHPAVLHFLQAVNSSGGVYAHRWGDAPIQTAALRLHGAPSSVVHLDMDYVHLSTQNRIVGGEETAFDAEGLVNEHFRRLVAMANCSNRSSNATSNSSNGSSSGGNPSASPPLTSTPPSSPAPPAHPPMPPLIPAPNGFTSVGSLAQLRAAIKATPPGGQLRVFLPPDAEYRLGGEEIVVGSIDLTLVSSGSGATLDAHHESRLFKVQNGASLHLSLISLLNGFSESGGGAMVVLSSSVSLSACLIVNSSSNLRGGVFSMDGSSLTVAGGSRIQNSASSFYAGVLYMLRSSAIVTDGTLISNSTSTMVGGVLGLINGAFLISNRTVIRGSSSQYAGALAVEAGTMRMSESYVFSSRCSMSGGAVAMVTGSTIIENGCMFSDSHAGDTGGAFALTGGVLTFRSSSILDSASTASGGAIVISGGYVNLIGSRIVNSTATQGGAIEISAGFLNMSHASTVTRSVASRVGGGMFVHGGSVLIDGNCVLEDSYAQESGAAMFVVTGSVILQRSSVVDSVAMQYGGALYISGSGSVTISRSLVARSRAGSAGGCFYAAGGELMLVLSTAEDCTSSGSVGGVLSVLSANVGHGPLMLLTSIDFRLRVCQGSLFEQQGNAQFILRNITFTPLEGCNRDVLSSPGAFVGLTTKTCGESYLEPIQGQWQMVCSSNTAGACEINSVPATILASLTCSCPSPEYVNPSMEDPALAPYQPLGCLKPRMFKALEVVSNKVSISLVKPDTMFQQINATLVMQGNDFAHPARWEILNASAVHAIGWLKIPFTSGEIAGRDESAIDIVTRTQALEVTLLVEARTSFAVWGKHHPAMWIIYQ
ncbi:hypothetical protein AB1Y20_001108 [Prymnesium parvum]|uniref:Protein xylosyltransferase n=1 Tax=Prymnesium parvum TaxID=97485 RepID=A0AB34KAH3_PRYPA